MYLLSLGLRTSHARCALASSFFYARKSAKVAVVGGIVRWGLMGTGWRCCTLVPWRVLRLRCPGPPSKYPILDCRRVILSVCVSILLRVGLKFISHSFFHNPIVSHDVGCCWNDIFDCSFEIIDDGLRQIEIVSRNFLEKNSSNLSSLFFLASSINFYWLVSLLCQRVILEMLVVPEILLKAVERFFLPFPLHPRCMRYSLSSVIAA